MVLSKLVASFVRALSASKGASCSSCECSKKTKLASGKTTLSPTRPRYVARVFTVCSLRSLGLPSVKTLCRVVTTRVAGKGDQFVTTIGTPSQRASTNKKLWLMVKDVLAIWTPDCKTTAWVRAQRESLICQYVFLRAAAHSRAHLW